MINELRLHAGLTYEQIAQAADWSLSKVHRFMGGHTSLSTTDLRFLLREVIGVEEQRVIDALIEQGRERRAKRRS